MNGDEIHDYISHLRSLIRLERDEQKKKTINEIGTISGEERENTERQSSI